MFSLPILTASCNKRSLLYYGGLNFGKQAILTVASILVNRPYLMWNDPNILLLRFGKNIQQHFFFLLSVSIFFTIRLIHFLHLFHLWSVPSLHLHLPLIIIFCKTSNKFDHQINSNLYLSLINLHNIFVIFV